MKKKGLIVATIVMVLVLATSITTATYAWFTATTVTSLEGFSVSVVASNAVNIGVKTTNQYEANPHTGMFMSGDNCTYAAGTPGAIGGGTWSGGNPTLGPSIQHNIVWGAQQNAVGLSTASSLAEATVANTSIWGVTGGQFAVAATVENSGATQEFASNKAAAIPNVKGTAEEPTSGDYVYLFLGVQPTTLLDDNQLIILITAGTTSPILGILSAIHVAYRINDTTEWTDVDVFGQGDVSNRYSDTIASVSCNLTEVQKTAYNETYGSSAPEVGAKAVIIDGLTTEERAIDQVEIVIYIAGADSDCIDAAKGASGSIQIFFNTAVSD